MPKAKKEPPKRDVGVRMEGELHSRLLAHAQARRMSVALIVRIAVREYLEARENDGGAR